MHEAPGRVTIAPNVLISIGRLTAMGVPGVVRLCPSGLSGVLRRGANEGVLVEVEGQRVNFDLFIVADGNLNLRQIGQEIQIRIARAIRDMVGMDAGVINVHIQDVVYPELERKTE